MKKIGILFGGETSFPSALLERINARKISGIEAEFVQTGAVRIDQASGYAVIVDRVSHEIPFYRVFLRQAALNGTAVINNPFWFSAGDRFFFCALVKGLGVAVPATVVLPHKQLPAGVTDASLSNLEYPLDWDAIFTYVGEHGFLKPIDGGERDVHEVRSREEFFRAYDQSRDLCMIYQSAVACLESYRCCVVGRKKVRVMAYNRSKPLAERYSQNPPECDKKLLRLMEQNALKLCHALGCDFNTVEFAVENGIPYAIHFMNPMPDANAKLLGEANFDWIVQEVADLAIAKARKAPSNPELHWSALLDEDAPKAARKKPAAPRSKE